MSGKLIGLHGKARSGKDTVADFIQSWCNANGFTSARQGFADKLKISAAHTLGVFENEVEFCNKLKGDYERGFIEVHMATKGDGPNAVVSKVTGREFLQYYGTEAHRDVFGSDFWVDSLLPGTEEKYGHRYEEENYGGTTTAGASRLPDWWANFRVGALPVADFCLVTDVRFDNEAERIKELGGEVWRIVRDGSGAGEHASEVELPGELVNVTIDNNESMLNLAEAVETIMADVSQLEAISNG